ncbi:MAG: hypothetical protein IJR82_04985, partial [Bacilli bacterium]|nr:hypothetical protein [Bacilli bacterium]
YRFSLDFPDMSRMDEEEKHFGTSIWLGVNKTPVKAGNTLTVRRCDTAIAFVGSPTMSYDNITEIHYEPVILENEMKYMQVYYNDTMPVPQAEWYLIMQLNYFTNQIKINDRFLFGIMDVNRRDNNSAYKVKAVIKANQEHTFIKDHNDEMLSTSLVTFALDKDSISPNDDLENRIAYNTAIYPVEYNNQHMYYIDVNNQFKDISLGKSYMFSAYLCYDGNVIDVPMNFSYKLNGVKEENYNKYFSISITDNTFKITNKKQAKGKLIVTAICKVPNTDNECCINYEITLTGASSI